MWCKPWELAKKLGLKHYYVCHNGNVNGAIVFYNAEAFLAQYEVLEERGIYGTFEQRLELLEGQDVLKVAAE